MGRRYLADPALATHDPLTHEPARASALDRNRYVTSPAVPPGYADFARGGAKHVPPPPLGHHALTPRFQDAERLAGGRPAGASREEIAPKTAHWAKETSYEIYADSETLDGSLSAAAESRRRSRETTETSRRFAAPPRDHEPRVALPRRHPSDASVVIKHRDGAFPGAYAPASDDVGKHVRDGTPPSPRRPFPPPRGVVHIGADGPPVQSLVSANTEHYARESSRTDSASVSGAGGASTRVPGYDVITGAPRRRRRLSTRARRGKTRVWARWARVLGGGSSSSGTAIPQPGPSRSAGEWTPRPGDVHAGRTAALVSVVCDRAKRRTRRSRSKDVIG